MPRSNKSSVLPGVKTSAEPYVKIDKLAHDVTVVTFLGDEKDDLVHNGKKITRYERDILDYEDSMEGIADHCIWCNVLGLYRTGDIKQCSECDDATCPDCFKENGCSCGPDDDGNDNDDDDE